VEILLLKYTENWSYHEIAAKLGITHSAVETRLHRDSHITTNTGYTLNPADVARGLERVHAHLPQASWLTMSGSLPPGAPEDLYAQLVNMATAAGVSSLVDGYGAPARAAAAARPTILKMNRSELAQTFGLRAISLDALVRQTELLRRDLGVANIVITGGGEGILALTGEGAYLAKGPAQPAVNAAGAGDAVSGTLAWRLSAGDTWPNALRWAAAAGAATVLTARTAECHRADADRILPLTSVEVYQVQP
jgi:fructose-1-phosphate kinase PfkB-like protein